MELEQCRECGGWQCSPCDDCGNIVHVRHGYPFCPHGLSSYRSDYAEEFDENICPGGAVITCARDRDRIAKARGREIIDLRYDVPTSRDDPGRRNPGPDPRREKLNHTINQAWREVAGRGVPT